MAEEKEVEIKVEEVNINTIPVADFTVDCMPVVTFDSKNDVIQAIYTAAQGEVDSLTAYETDEAGVLYYFGIAHVYDIED